TSRSLPQQTAQIFSAFAGQKRSALRFSQIGQDTESPQRVKTVQQNTLRIEKKQKQRTGPYSYPAHCGALGNLWERPHVPSHIMQSANPHTKAPEWLICIGAGIFILILGVSAFWEPDIRWLHFFQAWMYIATIVLSLGRSRWGYFIGISAAGLWDYANIVATTFFLNGLQELWQWTHTGRLEHPDLLIAVPAWFSNLFVVIGSLWAYFRLSQKSAGDTGRFLLAFVLTTGFFALDMALFQPRYLGIFPRLLHPHLP
ncbi:MAG TPA: hypothetical protein VI431_12225, partial [Candidatus Acidoferrum sp.]